jgi:hypothetical protein
MARRTARSCRALAFRRAGNCLHLRIFFDRLRPAGRVHPMRPPRAWASGLVPGVSQATEGDERGRCGSRQEADDAEDDEGRLEGVDDRALVNRRQRRLERQAAGPGVVLAACLAPARESLRARLDGRVLTCAATGGAERLRAAGRTPARGVPRAWRTGPGGAVDRSGPRPSAPSGVGRRSVRHRRLRSVRARSGNGTGRGGNGRRSGRSHRSEWKR